MNKQGGLLKSPALGIHIIAAAVLIFLTVYSARLTVTDGPYWAIIITIGISAAFITFVSPTAGLYLLLIAMMFSPEIPLRGVGRRRAVLRYDDLLIIFIFLSWFSLKVFKKEMKFLRKTPLDKPIIFFIFICGLATARGILIHQVYPLQGALYVLKLIEYVMIYYMVVNNIESRFQIKNFLIVMFLVCFGVTLYGLQQIGDLGRVTAPFEGVAEPNTFGGYYILMFGLIMGLIIHNAREIKKAFLVILIALMIPVFLYTLSRGSYLAYFPVIFILIAFAGRGKRTFPIVFFIITLISFPFMPERVKDRFYSTFRGRVSYALPTLGYEPREVTLDPSSVARLETWDKVVGYWLEYPILGLGITGAGFIDSQWMRTVGELGLAGIIAVAWLFKSLLKHAFFTYKHAPPDDNFIKGMGLGYLAGLTGLMTHAVTANTFYIVRIMGPFWFLTAMIMILEQYEKEEIDKEAGQSETLHG